MARGPGVARRIDHILAGVPEHAVGRGARLMAAGAVLAAAAAIAGAHAKEAPAPLSLPLMLRAEQTPRPLFAAAAPQANPVPPARTSLPHAAAASRVHAQPASDVTYNPRALLDPPGVAVIPAIVPMSGRGKAEDSFILNGSSYVGGN
jgi:hypothetical protein